MSFLKKLFAPRHPLDSLRKAVQQQRWADALADGETVPRHSLPTDEAEELDLLLTTAGDALAEFNLVEGEACLRAGDTARAREHFTLAASQACNPVLTEKARSLLTSFQSAPATPPTRQAAASSCCPTGCGGDHPGGKKEMLPDELDMQTHLDLLLGTYPKELADRYVGLNGSFLRAFLLAHEGHLAEALDAFTEVAENDRNDLFFFERGTVLARSGKGEMAAADLERALALNPGLDLARQTLVSLELALGQQVSAETRLQKMLQEDSNLSFALGRLAALAASRGEKEAALDYALRALEHGAEPETFALAGALLEQAGRFGEAEACLSRLSGSGCGSVNLPLAEFWLRHRTNLEKALQTFKSALRQEPDNPRWKLRIGQAYLALGWRKEGVTMLQQVWDAPHLEESLREEAAVLLESSR